MTLAACDQTTLSLANAAVRELNGIRQIELLRGKDLNRVWVRMVAEEHAEWHVLGIIPKPGRRLLQGHQQARTRMDRKAVGQWTDLILDALKEYGFQALRPDTVGPVPHECPADHTVDLLPEDDPIPDSPAYNNPFDDGMFDGPESL